MSKLRQKIFFRVIAKDYRPIIQGLDPYLFINFDKKKLRAIFSSFKALWLKGLDHDLKNSILSSISSHNIPHFEGAYIDIEMHITHI